MQGNAFMGKPEGFRLWVGRRWKRGGYFIIQGQKWFCSVATPFMPHIGEETDFPVGPGADQVRPCEWQVHLIMLPPLLWSHVFRWASVRHDVDYRREGLQHTGWFMSVLRSSMAVWPNTLQEMGMGQVWVHGTELVCKYLGWAQTSSNSSFENSNVWLWPLQKPRWGWESNERKWWWAWRAWSSGDVHGREGESRAGSSGGLIQGQAFAPQGKTHLETELRAGYLGSTQNPIKTSASRLFLWRTHVHVIVPHALCEMFFSGGNISKCLFILDSKPVTLRKQFYQSLLGEPGGIIGFFFFWEDGWEVSLQKHGGLKGSCVKGAA